MFSWCNTKFSWLIYKEMYDNKMGELKFRSHLLDAL